MKLFKKSALALSLAAVLVLTPAVYATQEPTAEDMRETRLEYERQFVSMCEQTANASVGILNLRYRGMALSTALSSIEDDLWRGYIRYIYSLSHMGSQAGREAQANRLHSEMLNHCLRDM